MNANIAMDPNLFHLDWERLAEVLATVVVLSLVVERALSIVFEHRLYIANLRHSGAKEFIAFGVSLFICWFWQFDALSMIILRDKTSFLGEMVTAGVIAGGSKGSVKLFRDVMGFKSTAYREATGDPSKRNASASPSAPVTKEKKSTEWRGDS